MRLVEPVQLGIILEINKGCRCVCAAGLAQSVERLTAEREVVGSIPGAGPILRVLK